jgi:spore maturation protein CgeB
VTSPYAGRRVLLVDAVDTDASGHAPLRRRALQRLGCVAEAVDLAPRKGLLARWRAGPALDRLERALLQHQPELVLVAERAELDAGAVARLRGEARAPWAYWHVAGALDRLEAVAGAFDALFVPGSDLVERLRAPGRTAVWHLPPGCDPSVHRPVAARDQFRANVVFVGRVTPHRERMLAGLAEFGLAIWGEGWRGTALRDYCRGEWLATEDFVRAYAGATVAVNIHRDDEASPSRTGVNQRLFEVAAIGAAQVVDDRPDLALHFLAGQEVVPVASPAELKETVKALLQEETARERLAHAARQRALAEHTYMHRMAAILGATLGTGLEGA